MCCVGQLQSLDGQGAHSRSWHCHVASPAQWPTSRVTQQRNTRHVAPTLPSSTSEMSLPGTAGRGVLGSLLFEMKFWARYLLPTRYVAVYYPTHDSVVHRMLQLAAVGPSDTVYDLGCGDGRILVAAAQHHGARGVGVELDSDLVQQARSNVAAAGLQHMVRIDQGDAAQADLRGASVVALYLSERGNVSLLRSVAPGLQPATRVVSFYFPIHGWEERRVAVDTSQNVAIYLYRVPEGAGQGD